MCYYFGNEVIDCLFFFYCSLVVRLVYEIIDVIIDGEKFFFLVILYGLFGFK